MKVEVLTKDDVPIRKYRWWSDWIDISIFDSGYTGYLLQMQISRTNKKKFKCVKMSSFIGLITPETNQVGELTSMHIRRTTINE